MSRRTHPLRKAASLSPQLHPNAAVPLSRPLGVWPTLPTSDMLMLQMLLRTLGIASCFSRLVGWYSKVDRGMGQMGVILKGTLSSAVTPRLWVPVRG